MRSITQVMPVELSNGDTIKVEYTPRGDENVSQTKKKFSGVLKSVSALAEDIKEAIDKIKPDKTTVEFGIEITKESNDLVGLIVKGSGTANFKITLEWEKKSQKEDNAQPAS